MGSDQENLFGDDYLILKPESATLFDLFLFILPFDFGNIRKLVDCPPGKENSYRTFANRWVIFISILLQKFLLAISKLLKTSKLLRGKLWTVPHKTYAPNVRCRDWRIGVEKNIKLADDGFRYYGALTIMASTLAYEDYSPVPSVVETVVNKCWKMKLLECSDFRNDFQNKDSTQAFAFQNTATDPNVTVVAFRGSSSIDDWMVDFNSSWYSIQGIGHIHNGFMQALGLQKGTGWPKELPRRPDHHKFAYYTLRQILRDIAKANDKAKFIITGHSLGGALATLFVTILAFHAESALLQKLQAVYTFGQPRVGDHQFAQFMDNIKKQYGFKYYRYVYSFDVVPRVPFDIHDLWYKHFGGCVYFNSCYKGKFLEDQPNKNYFSLIWLIPKYLVAWWELIRSLIIPLFKGRDYFEGFSNLLFRLLGLLIPGASAHMTLNYINSNRYGKIQLSKDIETLILADHIKADYQGTWRR